MRGSNRRGGREVEGRRGRRGGGWEEEGRRMGG